MTWYSSASVIQNGKSYGYWRNICFISIEAPLHFNDVILFQRASSTKSPALFGQRSNGQARPLVFSPELPLWLVPLTKLRHMLNVRQKAIQPALFQQEHNIKSGTFFHFLPHQPASGMRVVLRFTWEAQIGAPRVRAGRTASLSPDCSERCKGASSCVSGCLSVGAKPTYTPHRKLQLHLGQHSPALHPDSGLAALWEVKPCSTAYRELPTHQPLSLIIPLLPPWNLFLPTDNASSCCGSKQMSAVGVSQSSKQPRLQLLHTAGLLLTWNSHYFHVFTCTVHGMEVYFGVNSENSDSSI